MKHTFLVNIDCGSDTDFIGISQELIETLDAHFSLETLSVVPWASHNPLGGPSAPTPPVAPA